jgi:hypothetical protein
LESATIYESENGALLRVQAFVRSNSPDSGAVSLPEAAPAPQNKNDSSRGKQTKRMFGVVPNFAAVSANTLLPPLSTREKFSLAAHDSVLDYSSFTWTGILAAQAILLNSNPELLLLAHLHGRSVGNLFYRGHCPRNHARGPTLLHPGSGRLFAPHRLRDMSGLRH